MYCWTFCRLDGLRNPERTPAAACLCLPPQSPWAFLARPWPASGLPLACFLGSLKPQKQKKIIKQIKDVGLRSLYLPFPCLSMPPDGPWAATGPPLACLRAPSGLLPGQPQASKKKWKIKTHDCCFRSLCLPLLASACLRMAPELPPARPWPASGLPPAGFLGSLKPQKQKKIIKIIKDLFY